MMLQVSILYSTPFFFLTPPPGQNHLLISMTPIVDARGAGGAPASAREYNDVEISHKILSGHPMYKFQPLNFTTRIPRGDLQPNTVAA
jgi:hypothetical protein